MPPGEANWSVVTRCELRGRPAHSGCGSDSCRMGYEDETWRRMLTAVVMLIPVMWGIKMSILVNMNIYWCHSSWTPWILKTEARSPCEISTATRIYESTLCHIPGGSKLLWLVRCSVSLSTHGPHSCELLRCWRQTYRFKNNYYFNKVFATYARLQYSLH
jgi:hypothetical protein